MLDCRFQTEARLSGQIFVFEQNGETRNSGCVWVIPLISLAFPVACPQLPGGTYLKSHLEFHLL